MGISVAQLLNTFSAKELREWQIYSLIEPFGEERADLRTGIIASILVNLQRKKGTRAYTASDFMPKFTNEIKTKPTTVGLCMKIEGLRETLSRIK